MSFVSYSLVVGPQWSSLPLPHNTHTHTHTHTSYSLLFREKGPVTFQMWCINHTLCKMRSLKGTRTTTKGDAAAGERTGLHPLCLLPINSFQPQLFLFPWLSTLRAELASFLRGQRHLAGEMPNPEWGAQKKSGFPSSQPGPGFPF